MDVLLLNLVRRARGQAALGWLVLSATAVVVGCSDDEDHCLALPVCPDGEFYSEAECDALGFACEPYEYCATTTFCPVIPAGCECSSHESQATQAECEQDPELCREPDGCNVASYCVRSEPNLLVDFRGTDALFFLENTSGYYYRECTSAFTVYKGTADNHEALTDERPWDQNGAHYVDDAFRPFVFAGAGCDVLSCEPLDDAIVSLLEYTATGVRQAPSDAAVAGEEVPVFSTSVADRSNLYVEVAYYATDSCDGEMRVLANQVPEQSEASCVVNGVEYPSYTEGIDDPFSCGTCYCYQGGLKCEGGADCPKSCPDGHVQQQSCARCESGLCAAVETSCRPTCKVDADCEALGAGICEEDVCVQRCE